MFVFAIVGPLVSVMAPPLIVKRLLIPPKELLPLATTVPALSVKLAALELAAFGFAPMIHVPFPLLFQIWFVAVADQLCDVHVSVTPSATVTVLPPTFVDSVPAWETTVLALTVIFPIRVLAKVTAEVASKTTSVFVAHAVVNGPADELPQFAAVQVALAPFVFQ